tara:strand:- start:2534 stop:5113 length:2580 start_codon:yes stop_codon:yes gene_type:complete
MATNTEKIVVQVVVQGDKQLDKLEKKTKSTTLGFGKMAAGVLAAVATFRKVNQVVAASIRSFRDFEFQMAKVKAITGANRSEFLQLSKSAQDLGRSTFFTAQQVAELQTNYGKLGFTTKEILDAQEATLQLATATDSDLGRAAVVAGAAVRGFGLNANETARVTDVMAKAFTSSALDLEKFQTSMTKVAPIAKSAGFSIEDTTAIMAQLADSGIEASIAGTSLRNILLKMQDPNSDLVKSFGKTIHSLDELVPALTKFSEEGGSLAEIMEVVDLRQAAAFEQMITSRKRTVELRDALVNAKGAAAEMARIVGDTLEGALKRSQSATQGFQIVFMQTFGDALKNVIDGFATLVNKFTEFIELPMSETLDNDRVAMNNLFKSLEKTNISQDTRNRLIGELNLKYGEYLPFIIDEKTKLEDLKIAQNGANDAMLRRVTIMAAEEALRDVVQRRLDNQIEATRLVKEETELQNEKLEAQDGSYKRAIQSSGGYDRTLMRITTSLDANSKAQEKNKKEAEELDEEYTEIANTAANLKINIDGVTKSITGEGGSGGDGSGGGGGGGKGLSQAMAQSTIETRIQNNELQNYINIMGGVIDKSITLEQAQEQLRQQRIKDIEETLANAPLIITDYQTRLKLEKQLIDLKLQGLTDEEKKRKEQIGQMQQVGQQLITLAGNDEKYQKVRELGVRISAAAALANNAEALSLQMKGLSADLALGFPANLIAVASTLALLLSMKQNFQVLARGEQFANGGMVQGKSHAQGGEKFAVGGRVVELEGGEAVINKRSTAMFRNQLSAMNAAGGGVKFADGGLLNMPSFTQQQFNALGQTQMMGAMQGGRKVVVVEADITNAQDKVSVIESQATL